jgi:hypothetical protein
MSPRGLTLAAATTWCPSGNDGEVTVDLGRIQRLEG